MSEIIELNVEKREASEPASAVREAGFVPGVVYGPADEPTLVKVKSGEFLKAWRSAGESSILNLKGLDEDKEVLIKEVQIHPVKEYPLHADFYAIERGKTLTLSVPLEFVGEAPAEKLGGIVVKVMHEIEIETRPSQIPQNIEVDLSLLENLDSVISVADLKLPEGVKVLADESEVLASVSEQSKEESEESAPEEGAAETIESANENSNEEPKE